MASSTHELTITALGGRGDGVARLPSGEVVFIADVAPGDRVRAEVAGKRRGVKRGRVIEVLRPGAARTEPRCPVARACGGCSWQHVTLDAQRAEKARNVAQAIGMCAEQVGDVPAWGWRRRLRAHLRRQGGTLRAGFMGARSSDLVATDRCAVLEPELEALLGAVSAWAAPWLARGELLAQLGAEGVIARVQGVGRRDGPPPPDLSAEGEATAAALGVVGLSLAVDDEESRWGLTEVTLRETEGSHPIGVDAGGFSQASAAANEGIRQAVAAALATGGPFDAAVELFAGSGNLTGLLLDRAQRVETWEWNADAVARAQARYGDANGRLTIHQGDAGRVNRSPSGREVWLLDPGRPGAADACRRIERLAPDVVVYVSCAPDTLRRDLRLLAGYTATKAWWVDTFPHTPHAEVVVQLTRR